jgi:hypothetical protein
VASRRAAAAAAVAARTYDGGHLMAYVGAMNLELSPGPGSYGMRLSPSAAAYAAALAHAVRTFQWCVVLYSSDPPF